MLKNLLHQKKDSIIKKWYDQILCDYPLDTQKFLRREKDRFANPVGAALKANISPIYDWLMDDEATEEKVAGNLEEIMKIRAVQEFTPGQSVAFILKLKDIIRAMFSKEIEKNSLYKDLQQFEDKIDSLALISFNSYSKCRERLYQVRVSELKNMTSRVLKRLNVSLDQIPEEEECNDNNTLV